MDVHALVDGVTRLDISSVVEFSFVMWHRHPCWNTLRFAGVMVSFDFAIGVGCCEMVPKGQFLEIAVCSGS